MVHRVFRLSISPEHAPEVRRVIDFDGRCTLHNVHNAIQRELELDNDHLYAFYMSGKYFDRSSEHGLDADSRYDSGRSLLFRLGLRAGQQFAYLFDFGDELRHTLTVLSITDADAPLDKPVLVEAVGNAPSQYGGMDEEDEDDDDDDDEDEPLPEELAKFIPSAEAVLALSERLDELNNAGEQAEQLEAARSILQDLSKAALGLASELKEDEHALHELDQWSRGRELIPRLVELPLELVDVREFDSALAVARAFTFIAAEPLKADMALILAKAGQRELATAQLEAILKEFPESCLTAMKAGLALEALEQFAAAEASYRRGMAVAKDYDEKERAFELLLGLLEEMGQTEEIDALLSPFTQRELSAKEPAIAAVGRNEPCPCGSGKKYKKCHGA